MKRVFLVIASFVLLISGSFTVASAEDIAGRHGLGIGLGYTFSTPKNVDSTTVPSINYTYGITSNYSLELSIGRLVTNVKNSGIDVVDVTVMPLQVTGQYRIPTEAISYYLGACLGYYFNSLDGSKGQNYIRSLGYPDATYKADMDNSFGYHINIGADLFVNKNLVINLDVRKLWSEADSTEKLNIPSIGYSFSAKRKSSLDTAVAGIGIKYFF